MRAHRVAERQSTGLGISDMGSGSGWVMTSPENLNRSLELAHGKATKGVGRPDDPSRG